MGFSFSFFMIIFPSYSQQPNIVSSYHLDYIAKLFNSFIAKLFNSFIVDGFSFSRF